MSDKPRTGRILRDLRQVRAEEAERKRAERGKYEYDLAFGNIPPVDPVERVKWEEERRRDEEGIIELQQWLDEEEAELQKIKDSRPLGVPPPIEPRSIHSPVPQPPWKRKLRP